MRKYPLVPAAFAVTAAVLTLSGCGTAAKSADPAAPAAAVASPGAASPASDSDTQPSEAGRLSVWQSPELGPVVTDGAGFTLYRFDDDTASPPSSTCAGDCAVTWPPIPADDVEAGQGIDSGLLGSVARADGTQQLTLAGRPLYRYVRDTAPRQTNGQGVGGTWFAAAPDGKKAAGAAGTSGAAGTAGAAGAKEAAATDDRSTLPDLSTVEDKTLGTLVRDGKGRTLYRFTKDTDWPMKSNCTGKCLESWRPAAPVNAGDGAIEGIDPKLLSTYARPDGAKQLALDCWPLYWFTGDRTPGDTNGQGVGGTWFAVRPDGSTVR